MRVSRDDQPQASGEIQHLHYKTGYEMRLRIELWKTIGDTGHPAWHSDRVAMGDFLQKCLNSIVGDDPFLALTSTGRIQWTPSGVAVKDRMLDKIRLLERPVFTDDDMLTTVTFAVMAERPYAMDAPETDTALPNNTPTTLVNGGTADFFPVVEVYGPTSFFELTNASYLDPNGNSATVRYDSSLPGAISIPAGNWVELDFWRNTAYLHGDSTNCKPGIDITLSDFWPLIPGNNSITVSGATALVKYQNAYA